jgi:diguanylate cyclase (GGDEF)-like protein
LPILIGWALYSSKSGDDVRHFRIILTLGTILLMGALASVKQSRSDEELARANQELREASLSDLLTGARNRRYLTSTIDADVQQVIRDYAAQNESDRRNRDLIFYLIDADHFKEVTDQFGHDVGDQVLIEIARRISTAIRNSDVLIRWGGEEFLVVSRYTDRDNAAALAARVLAAVGSDLFPLKDGESIRRTCSIGWSVFPWFVGSPEAVPYTEVLRMADNALYEAKKGRNQAFGMMPTSELPASAAEMTPLEQLPAQTVVIQGPEITKTDLREAPAGAKTTVVS